MAFFIDTSSLALIDAPSFFFHAHTPSKDASFDVFAVSVLGGSRSGAGGGIALEAVGEGPSPLREDTAATSLFDSVNAESK